MAPGSWLDHPDRDDRLSLATEGQFNAGVLQYVPGCDWRLPSSHARPWRVRASIRVIPESGQFDGRAVFDNERDADPADQTGDIFLGL